MPTVPYDSALKSHIVENHLPAGSVLAICCPVVSPPAGRGSWTYPSVVDSPRRGTSRTWSFYSPDVPEKNHNSTNDILHTVKCRLRKTACASETRRTTAAHTSGGET